MWSMVTLHVSEVMARTKYLPCIDPVDLSSNASQRVREDTAELASLALSDIASSRSEHSPSRNITSINSLWKDQINLTVPKPHVSVDRRNTSVSAKSGNIQETPEPISPSGSCSSKDSRCQSALTQLLKNSPPSEDQDSTSSVDEASGIPDLQSVTVHQGIISQPNERTRLLGEPTLYGPAKDSEYHKPSNGAPTNEHWLDLHYLQLGKSKARGLAKCFAGFAAWDKKDLMEYGLLQPVRLGPPVILGLLLNILDALSYGKARSVSSGISSLMKAGMILFPLADPVFEDLGSDGIAMFYISCIVSQLVFSCGGSRFKGAIGSEMVGGTSVAKDH